MKKNLDVTKTAFSAWNNRVAPVFDVAGNIYVIGSESGNIISEQFEDLEAEPLSQKPHRLVELGIDNLVCGAISRPMHAAIVANGIRVISFVAGDLRSVIQAWLSGALQRNTFAMPGYCRQRRIQQARLFAQEGIDMRARNQGGGGMRNCKGQGQGRMGGSMASGPAGFCVCSQCGHKEPHARGIPCIGTKCPKCEAPMTREQ